MCQAELVFCFQDTSALQHLKSITTVTEGDGRDIFQPKMSQLTTLHVFAHHLHKTRSLSANLNKIVLKRVKFGHSSDSSTFSLLFSLILGSLSLALHLLG